MLLRDVDLSTDWDVEANALDARHYYCQNWRADASVIVDDSATIIERVMYSPYGVPFGAPAGDLVTSLSFAQPADGIVDGADNAVMLTSYSGSWNYADLDNDGDVDSDDLAVLSANWGDNLGWGLLSNHHNRFGYAGYVFDEALAGTKWHVRHRVLESVLGRWISRDPLGYVDGMGLLNYAGSRPMQLTDPSGQFSINYWYWYRYFVDPVLDEIGEDCRCKLREGNPNPAPCFLESENAECARRCAQDNSWGFSDCNGKKGWPTNCCACDTKLRKRLTELNLPVDEILPLFTACTLQKEAAHGHHPCCMSPYCKECLVYKQLIECFNNARSQCTSQACRDFFGKKIIPQLPGQWSDYCTKCLNGEWPAGVPQNNGP